MQAIHLPKGLPFIEWPQEIRRRWDAAFAKGDFLDDGGPGAHLQPTSRAALKSACARFLRYLSLEGCELDAEAFAIEFLEQKGTMVYGPQTKAV